MKTLLAIVVVSVIGLNTTAQGQEPASSIETKPKVETFTAKTGAVVIRGHSIIGSVRPPSGSAVVVESRELIDANDGTKMVGILITVVHQPANDSSYIGYYDVDSLLAGIDYIAKIKKNVTKLDNFQADYTTAGGLTVSTFTDDKGDIVAAVKIGSAGPRVDLSLDNLTQLKALIQKAKSKLFDILE